ncbi:sugar-transfer associated ATP-grasp domain-containing protein [Paraburkholderia sp. PREW-6R]|uniref:sugar-transfer associated ATP-grasp domain-containing protein n=1 Tax=Paraburkholderia sp. PREW-6R TaxID=3141544 RepID=UPI0031F4E9AC
MRIDVEDVVRRAAKRAARYKFHRFHRVQARRALQMLEGKSGRIDPRNLKLADSYAREVFGSVHYAPWLRVYTAFCGTFKEGWIPDNYYGSVVVPNLKGGYGTLSSMKTVSRLIFGSEGFPDVGYFANGLFFSHDNVAVPPEKVRDVMFRDSDRIVFKLDGSAQGIGIFVYDRESFDIEAIRSLGNGVMQRFVDQHPTLAAFAPKSVATLRVTTAVDDAGVISLRACFLRLGRANDTHVRAAGDVCVAVDLTTGQLGHEGYLNDWIAVTEHPDSHVPFAGTIVPSFKACIQKALELHRKVPFARCVGWDFAVDVNGNVAVLEWNGGHNDVKFSEATQGPCFADLKWERLNPAR